MMGLSVPGYRLTHELHRSDRSLVYRGIRESDQQPVLIKTINRDQPEPHEVARLKREHRILSSLGIPGVIRTYGLERWENQIALVLEDCTASPLSEQLGPQECMPLGAFFRLAIACAQVLARLHQHAIHKNLNPRSILWNPQTDELRLVDFSLASEVSRERQEPGSAKRLVGSLAFVSPEQTGRMNRDVDFRTDFYSLGVTFYLLLTGRLPFTANDPMEWVYCHITQVPEPPHLLNALVPEPLSELVLKLMAKNPEDRYQSAQGLLRDLTECHRRWRETGTIESFELARHDVMAQFQVPQRLYGRQEEIGVVLEAFQTAASDRTVAVMLAGPAGIGKSALVSEVCQAIVDANGRFAAGKFDQFHRHVPYVAIAQAIEGLVRQLLSEPEERLQQWKSRLLEALGPNGRIAVDLVPGLASLIGQPPPVAGLNPTEEQNRFLATIQSLIEVFARPEQPLVLFLDDLQWSDTPTLTLLQRLLEAREEHSLLLIGAYRDDELDERHPLARALERLAKTQRLKQLRLAPLSGEVLNRVVADTLQAAPEATRPLAEILHRKTDGNPFFVGELLRIFHQDGLFAFDHAEGCWRWDLDGVKRAPISDDIVDFMVGRIQRLEAETQRQLRQAACIGRNFDLHLLARVLGQPLSEVLAALRPAIAAGLVAPLSAEHLLADSEEDVPAGELRCQFLHDRVRQATYALMPEAERRQIHLQIGRLLLERTPEAERPARASEIVQQLNLGRSLIGSEAERSALAALNLVAARRAKASAAYSSAFDFVSVAHELLPAEVWQQDFALAFEVLTLRAACADLCGEQAVAQACYAELLQRCRGSFERAEIHAMQAAHHAFRDDLDRAVEEGIRALKLLGIPLAPRPGMGVVLRELLRSKLILGRRKAAELDDGRSVSDPRLRLAMKVLVDFIVPAYLTGNETLFATTALLQANLSMRHGNCDESVSAFVSYAVLLAGLGDLDRAYEFGRLALALDEKFGAADARCRTLVLYALFSHSWSRPWQELDALFKASVEAGLRSGDFLFMAFAAGYVHLWDPAVDLKTAIEESRKYLALCKQAGNQNALDAGTFANQLRLNLRGETSGPLSLSDAHFDEQESLARMQRVNYVSGMAIYRLCKLQAACFQADWAAAWSELLEAESVIKALGGSPYMVDYCVYGFQAAAGIAARKDGRAPAALRRMRKARRQMRAWARHCPENFAHHLALMEAELARLEGRFGEAPPLYEEAVAAAVRSGFRKDQARAYECAAHYYSELGLEKAASAYWREAHDAYLRWGALCKVRALASRLPRMLSRVPSTPSSEPFDLASLDRFHLGLVPQLVESGMLDLTTVWKATQAISGEARYERLLEKLLAIVKESAGAQKAVLVLREAETPEFRVQAESPLSGEPRLLQGEALDAHTGVPVSLIRYVLRSQTSVVLQDAAAQGAYTRDAYILAARPRSVLAMPIVNQGHLLGVLYLENNLLSNAFTPERLSVLQILAGQAAVSLQTLRTAERAAYLEAERTIKDGYARELEQRVHERTAELKEAYEQLMELDRLKTNFLNVVSHELRTPLTSIHGFTEFLEDRTGGELTDDQEEFVTHIRRSTAQLRRLVDDLLDFARAEAGSLRVVKARTDLTHTLAKAIESLTPQVRAQGLRIETRLPSQPVLAEADPGRIAQVLTNLVGNAIKFTPEGGTISVSLRPSDHELRVEVTDTGVGIDAQHLPRLFQKFYQVDSSSTRTRGGVGLGLAIAQSIIEAHAGQIGVTSSPGRGSTFWFTLPRQEPPGTDELKPAASLTQRG